MIYKIQIIAKDSNEAGELQAYETVIILVKITVVVMTKQY